MPAKQTAGILVYRIRDDVLEVLLAHAGGPFWGRKDAGAWSIFKGEPDKGEELLETAKREFKEETSQPFPVDAGLIELGQGKLSGGKIAHIWALERDYDPKTIISNDFEMEWPPKSGKMQTFPENDRAAWFDADTALVKLFKGQDVFVHRLHEKLSKDRPGLRMSRGAQNDKSQPSLF